MGTNYESGRNFEYRVRGALKKMGFEVIRSAGSKTPADLIAGWQGVVLLVQCTTSSESKNQQDRDRLVRMAREFGGLPMMVWRERPRGPLVWDYADSD